MNQNNVSNKPVKKVVKNKVHCGEQLTSVFDYTKAHFHDTNYGNTSKMVKRSDYCAASDAENNFNDELKNWKKRNGENVNTSVRRNFAAHLSQKYLCNKLDKLESSEIISRIRKGIARQIDELENHKKESNITEDIFANMSLKVEELSEDASSVASSVASLEEEYNDCNDTDEIQIPTDNINLCFVGGVSTGKSTVLNSVFCEELTQCKIKRTTMWPTVYVENDFVQDISPEEILKIISEKKQGNHRKDRKWTKIRQWRLQRISL